MGNAKLKRMKIMRIFNANMVRGHLSKNYLTRKFITRNIFNMQFMVYIHVHLIVCVNVFHDIVRLVTQLKFPICNACT